MLKLRTLLGIIYQWFQFLERKVVENMLAINAHYPQVVRLGQVAEDYRKTRPVQLLYQSKTITRRQLSQLPLWHEISPSGASSILVA